MANSAAWAKLDDVDRQALTAAAADTRTHAVSDVQVQEQTELTNLCRTGTVIVQPSAAALKAMATRAASGAPLWPATTCPYSMLTLPPDPS